MLMNLAVPRFIALFAIAIFICALVHADDGEFEGGYRIGEMTCIVTPIKMAFDVQCSDENEPMVFFYDLGSKFGDRSYVSEERPDGADRFVFFDESLSSGEYIDSVGIRLPVNRIKSNK